MERSLGRVGTIERGLTRLAELGVLSPRSAASGHSNTVGLLSPGRGLASSAATGELLRAVLVGVPPPESNPGITEMVLVSWTASSNV